MENYIQWINRKTGMNNCKLIMRYFAEKFVRQHTDQTQTKKYTDLRLVPAQDFHFFYTHSHLSALQNSALIFSTNFQFIFTFKKCTTQFNH